jgi:hypothetical protein
MVHPHTPASLDFLQDAPEPVTPAAASSRAPAGDRLPQPTADRLLQLPGVDGAWIERDARGGPVVVIHYSPGGPTDHLPRIVDGLPTRIVGGGPIRAY